MSTTHSSELTFNDLNLSKPVMKAVNQVAYEIPTPIQAEMIPHVLAGKDVLGQAQTGTGKTAAFAMPLLSNLDLKEKNPQVLVLAPTRELAIQVAEAFQRYAVFLKGFRVLPIYGGQAYDGQLRRLKQGVHVVVGTPGRVMDHMRRGSLNLAGLRCLVLDEADEMLRMGFIDDVRWILDQTPPRRQIALFSATLPQVIRKIAKEYMREPVEVTIKAKTTTVKETRQRYWMVSGFHKLDALTRILETEHFDGVIIFVRTKTATIELAEKLAARGYACAPLNGDIQQKMRERTIEQLKKGKINILVATDVAARGLDVERVSHVINYDIPYDTEAYIHRIGRTGRAGRSGEAILFVAPREKRMLRAIEKATRQKIELMELPATETINDIRIAAFKQRIADVLALNNLGLFYQIVEEFQQEQNVPALEVAAALAKLLQGDEPLLLSAKPKKKKFEAPEKTYKDKKDRKRDRKSSSPEFGMERFRIEVGHKHGVQPGNIVGAIANEAGLDSEYIGRINIFDEYSTVDLPQGMPDDLLDDLQTTWVSGRELQISRMADSAANRERHKKARTRPGPKKERKRRPKRKA